MQVFRLPRNECCIDMFLLSCHMHFLNKKKKTFFVRFHSQMNARVLVSGRSGSVQFFPLRPAALRVEKADESRKKLKRTLMAMI